MIRLTLLKLLAEIDKLLDTGGVESFRSQVEQALDTYWGDRADVTEETIQRLYRLAQGDALVVRDFVVRAAYRRKHGWNPTSLASYMLGTFRKVGVDQLRADLRARRMAKSSVNGNGTGPGHELGSPPAGPEVATGPEEGPGPGSELIEYLLRLFNTPTSQEK